MEVCSSNKQINQLWISLWCGDEQVKNYLKKKWWARSMMSHEVTKPLWVNNWCYWQQFKIIRFDNELSFLRTWVWNLSISMPSCHLDLSHLQECKINMKVGRMSTLKCSPECNWQKFSTGSSNGCMFNSDKPISEPMMTHIMDTHSSPRTMLNLQLGKISADEREHYICKVFSHWLMTRLAIKNGPRPH